MTGFCAEICSIVHYDQSKDSKWGVLDASSQYIFYTAELEVCQLQFQYAKWKSLNKMHVRKFYDGIMRYA